ncbi:MAG: sulfatase [Acidobacteria bacterium]|nr:sulfatase [Acidobacteriota bacterium]
MLQAFALLLGRYFAWYVVFLLAVVAPAALVTTIPPLALASVAAIFSAVLAYQTYGGVAPRIWLLTTLLSAVLLFVARRTAGRPVATKRGGVGMMAAAAALLLLETFSFHWLTRFPLRAWARSEPEVAITIYAVIILATAAVVLRSASSRIVGIVLATGLVAAAWLPARKLHENRYLAAPVTIAESTPKVPHIVLIVVDTLRADALTYRNPDARPTPNIDGLAADSVVFENAIYPAPWTYPSMDSVMTGVAPYIDHGEFDYSTAPLRTLGEYLLDAGYRTGLVSGNEIVDRPATMLNGIQEADVYSALAMGSYRTSLLLWETNPSLESEMNTAAVTDRGISWIRDAKDAPFFLWMQYFDPHDPYAPSPRYLKAAASTPALSAPYGASRIPEEDRASYTDYYRAEVQQVDEHVGRLIAELKHQNIYDDALIILMSDHGEEFWDHGSTLHGHSLYQELLHVPLLIKLPGSAQGRSIKAYTPTLALLPTILELAGISVDAHRGWAAPLTPLVRGETDAYPFPIVSAATFGKRAQRSVVMEGEKYVSWLDTEKEAVFNLDEDPTEQHDLAAEKPETIARAREILGHHEKLSAAIRTEYGLDLASAGPTPEMLNKLRSLGYIQ